MCMATWQTAGKVRMTPKGTYSSSTAYEILDIVTNVEGSTSYIAKQNVPAGTALTNTTYWAVVADVQSALDNASAALSYIADTYSSSSTYAVGDIVIHDGGLYHCKTAITTAENWTAAHWEQITLAEELTENINELKSDLTDVSGNTAITGWIYDRYMPCNGTTYNPSNAQGASNWRYVIVSCNAGDVFTINAKGGGIPRLWAFADSSNNILAKSDASVTGTNLVITAPTNASVLIINDNLLTGNSYKGKLLILKVNDNASRIDAVEDDLTAEIKQLKALRTDVTEWSTGGYINTAYDAGTTISITKTTNESWRCAVVPVSDNKEIVIDLVGGNSPRAYAFITSANVLISVAASGAFDGVLEIPTNADRIILNDNNSDGSAYLLTASGYVDELIEADETGVYSENNLAVRTNNNTAELRKIKNEIDDTLSSLLQIHDEGTETTVTIDAVGAHDCYLLRLGLHYGSSAITHDADEIFFGGTCRKDFSDVRFFDANGNMLKAEMGKPYNLDLVQDNRLKHALFVLSDGKVVVATGNSAIMLYTDNMATSTAIPNTKDVTEHGSDVYNYKSMVPVFVDPDDNIFAYAGGHLFKLSADDDYATITDVLDFTWVNSNGDTVYPDAQSHSMAMDTNGNLIFGTYALDTYMHVDVFRSTDGGDTWSLCWHSYDGEYMHVHHVHADAYTGAVYVGIDDGGQSYKGSRILKTTDGGANWTDITDQIMSAYPTRGKDFFPSYCGNGYRLGSAEAYIMGSASIYRSVDDAYLDRVVKGVAGAREIVDFGDDSLLIAGTCQSIGVSENHILISTDKGKTWESIFTKYQEPASASGIGYRRAISAATIDGDTEPCVILPQDIGNVPSYRLYKGGNHWYREAYILLENIPNEDIEITVKTGYMMGYPYKSLRNNYTDYLAYQIPLNEAAGTLATDGNGKTVRINGRYRWDSGDDGRYGDERGKNNVVPFEPKSGLLLEDGAYINFGSNASLDFSKDYTITFLFNTKGKFLDKDMFDNHRDDVYYLFSIGGVRVYKKGLYFFVADATNELTASNIATTPKSGTKVKTTNFNFTDNYYFVALSVDSDNICTASVLGETTISHAYDYAVSETTWKKLSNGNVVIGGNDSFKQIGYLSDIRVYDTALSLSDVLNIYRGMM